MNPSASDTASFPPTDTGRFKNYRTLKTLICLAFHRGQWYTRHTYDGGYYGEPDHESRRCRACGRRWKQSRDR